MKDIMNQLKYDENGLIPAITQDYKTDEILMLAYMNAESLKKTLETGKACYYSRSRQKLWLKGETSGHYQNVKSVSIDCDGDTLLLKVEQTGAACHTGHRSCFYRKIEVGADTAVNSDETNECKPLSPGEPLNPDETNEITPLNPREAGKATDGISAGPGVLKDVYNVITDRVSHPKEGSYTNYLMDKGLDKILKKIGEETSEVIIAAKNGSQNEICYEVADLIYHVMVMLVKQGMTLEDIYKELDKRR
ncbi:MAG: phosphoribosyl-AMP cyclohydrolase [Ruminiclostridium sp.]|nr:phosphoribosyl-AMP cyclohydrolase [Ruminiclostridium sp.]